MATRQQVLDKLVNEELEKANRIEAEERRRQAEQEALNKQIQAANANFEAGKAQLVAQTASLVERQKKWRSRFEFLLSEIESLSDDQEGIQSDISATIQQVENLVWTAQQAGGQVADAQTTWDDLGGADEALSPWPDKVSNSVALQNARWQNYVARWIYAKGTYSPKMRLDGRRR